MLKAPAPAGDVSQMLVASAKARQQAKATDDRLGRRGRVKVIRREE